MSCPQCPGCFFKAQQVGERLIDDDFILLIRRKKSAGRQAAVGELKV